MEKLTFIVERDEKAFIVHLTYTYIIFLLDFMHMYTHAHTMNGHASYS